MGSSVLHPSVRVREEHPIWRPRSLFGAECGVQNSSRDRALAGAYGYAGHAGYHHMMAALRALQVWWPGIKKDVKTLCGRSRTCMRGEGGTAGQTLAVNTSTAMVPWAPRGGILDTTTAVLAVRGDNRAPETASDAETAMATSLGDGYVTNVAAAGSADKEPIASARQHGASEERDKLVGMLHGLMKLLLATAQEVSATRETRSQTVQTDSRSRAEKKAARTAIYAARWAAWQGVPGQATHFERPGRRPRLWTARNMQRMGMTVPADLVTSCPARKLIGRECPVCNAEGEREIKAWYISEGHVQYDGVPRPRSGAARVDTAWKHTLDYCPKILERTHRWVREHPEDFDLFNPLPRGQEPGALP